MKRTIYQLNFETNGIAAIGVWPGRNHQRKIPLNAFMLSRRGDIFYAFVQHQRIIGPQQWIPGILPLPTLFIQIIHQQVKLSRIPHPERVERVCIAQPQITIQIRKFHLHLHKTVVPEATVKHVNPLESQRWRRRNCIFAPVAGAE